MPTPVNTTKIRALDEFGSWHLRPPLPRPRIGSSTPHRAIGAPQRQAERPIALGERVEDVRKVHELLNDHMDRLAFALDLAIDAEQRRAHDEAPIFFEQSRPDDQIGDARLVVDRDEHDALC